MTELLWFLLPIAAASGWYAAKRATRDASRNSARGNFSSQYFKGINYLLNEQPDKAIEVFIEVLEVDAETVETHLALGNLYRRRGEVDRAIRIHQNLVARSTISDEQRYEALLELAQDYLSAGLLDRAENLFRELVDAQRYTVQALRQLIDIFELEKDWEKGVGVARELEAASGSDLGNVISQYLCEQAVQAREHGNIEEALRLLSLARKSFGACVRASLIEGDILAAKRDFDGALAAYQRVESQDADYVPEVVDRILHCLEALGDEERAGAFLADVHERYGGMTAMLALAETFRRELGEAQAREFVLSELKKRPNLRGFEWLLGLGTLAEETRSAPAVTQIEGEPCVSTRALADHWSILKGLTQSLLEDRPVYKCQHCGFPAKLLHWRCPGCKHWSSVRPIHGVEGE